MVLAAIQGLNQKAEPLDGLDSTGFWKLGGNTGTTLASQFLGTTDGHALRPAPIGLSRLVRPLAPT